MDLVEFFAYVSIKTKQRSVAAAADPWSSI